MAKPCLLAVPDQVRLVAEAERRGPTNSTVPTARCRNDYAVAPEVSSAQARLGEV